LLPAHSRGFGLSCSHSISSPRGAPAIPAGGHKPRWHRAPGRRRVGAPTRRRADAPGRRRAGPSSAVDAPTAVGPLCTPPPSARPRSHRVRVVVVAAAGEVAAEGGAGVDAAARRSRLLCDLCCGVVVHICRHRRSLQGVLYPLFVRDSERTPSISRNL